MPTLPARIEEVWNFLCMRSFPDLHGMQNFRSCCGVCAGFLLSKRDKRNQATRPGPLDEAERLDPRLSYAEPRTAPISIGRGPTFNRVTSIRGLVPRQRHQSLSGGLFMRMRAFKSIS